jgi:hypothetical protein
MLSHPSGKPVAQTPITQLATPISCLSCAKGPPKHREYNEEDPAKTKKNYPYDFQIA